MKATMPGSTRHVLPAVLLLLALVLSVYPYLATRAQTGPTALPPLFAPDLYLYLNLSQLHAGGGQTVINPWYGVPLPGVALTYARFGLAFRLFDGFGHLLGGGWWTPVFLWNLLWTALIGLAGWWALGRLLPEAPPGVLGFGLALLMLFDLRTIPADLSAWLHLPGLRGFDALSLPYARQFFPQVAIPLLLLYVGLQVVAVRGGKWVPWLLMAAAQWAAFLLYPYATLLMAGITAFFLLLGGALRRFPLRVLQVLGFGALCGLLNGITLAMVGLGPVAGVSGQSFGFHGAMLLYMLHSRTLLLVALLSVAAAALPTPAERPVKWVAVALGGSQVLLMLGDTLFPQWLQVSHHADVYLSHTTLALLLAYLVAVVMAAVTRKAPRLLWAAAVALIVVLAHGALAARGSMRSLLQFNQAQAEQAGILQGLGLKPGDLVLARARFVDDTSGWVPLLTPARVLFCRNAEFVLSPADEERVQRLRLALYLYLTGRDAAWVQQVLSPSGPPDLQNFLSLTQQRLALESPERGAALARLQELIAPRLAAVAAGDPDAAQMLRGYDRILVIDRADDPSFVRSRLETYLRVEQEVRLGNYTLLWCKAL